MRQPAENLIRRHAALDEPIGRLHAVEKRQDRGAAFGQKAGRGSDLGERIRLHGHDRDVAYTERLCVVGRLNRDGEAPLWSPDLEPTREERVQMGAPCQQRDRVTRAGEDATVVAPDSARSENGDPHDGSVFHGSPDIIKGCATRFLCLRPEA